MISIDNVLISDQVVEEQFVCDLIKCKGGCCVDGDAGAPLENSELKELTNAYKFVAPYLTKECRTEVEQQGKLRIRSGIWLGNSYGKLRNVCIWN